MDFRDNRVDRLPVKADTFSALLDLVCLGQSRQSDRNAIQHALTLLALVLAFFSLDLFPVVQNAFNRIDFQLSKYMGMTTDDFFTDRRDHIGHIEILLFGGNLSVQYNL